MIEALKRLWQAIQQLGGKQDAGSSVSSGDLMEQVGAMQTYWRTYLQIKLADGVGYAGPDTSLTDMDHFMGPAGEDAVPDATLADLDELLEDDAAPPNWTEDGLEEPAPDGLADLDALLALPDDEDIFADL